MPWAYLVAELRIFRDFGPTFGSLSHFWCVRPKRCGRWLGVRIVVSSRSGEGTLDLSIAGLGNVVLLVGASSGVDVLFWPGMH